MKNIILQNPKVHVRIFETVKPYVSSEGITGGYNAYNNPSLLAASSAAKFTFTPSLGGYYNIVEYDIDATISTQTYNTSSETYYEDYYNNCTCGAIQTPSIPPIDTSLFNDIEFPITVKTSGTRTHDSYGVILRGTTQITYNDDSANWYYGLYVKQYESLSNLNYYFEDYCPNCDEYCYYSRYTSIYESPIKQSMMYYMKPSLNAGSTYTIYSLPYSSTSTTVNRNVYVLISYQG